VQLQETIGINAGTRTARSLSLSLLTSCLCGKSVTMKKANRIIYGVYGAVAVLLGVTALVFPTVLTSEAERAVPLIHILREEGAAEFLSG